MSFFTYFRSFYRAFFTYFYVIKIRALVMTNALGQDHMHLEVARCWQKQLAAKRNVGEYSRHYTGKGNEMFRTLRAVGPARLLTRHH
jgi:hypothetical protein